MKNLDEINRLIAAAEAELSELAEQAVEEARKSDGLSALLRANFIQSLGQIC